MLARKHAQGRSCSAEAVYLDLVVVCGTPVLQAVLKEEEQWLAACTMLLLQCSSCLP